MCGILRELSGRYRRQDMVADVTMILEAFGQACKGSPDIFSHFLRSYSC